MDCFGFFSGQSLKIYNGLSLGVFFLSLFSLSPLAGETGEAAGSSSENVNVISWFGRCPLKNILCHHIFYTFLSFNCLNQIPKLQTSARSTATWIPFKDGKNIFIPVSFLLKMRFWNSKVTCSTLHIVKGTLMDCCGYFCSTQPLPQ